jgi:hypothetical protein
LSAVGTWKLSWFCTGAPSGMFWTSSRLFFTISASSEFSGGGELSGPNVVVFEEFDSVSTVGGVISNV